MNSLMDQRLTHNSCRCQSKARITSPNQMRQSKIYFGDMAPCYTTTHNQSYSGRSSEGRPLIFHLRDPGFPPQHRTHLDLSQNTDPLPSHSQPVHEPKHTLTAKQSSCDLSRPGPSNLSAPTSLQRTDVKKENWARYCSGQAVREITNPEGPSEYWTTHRTEHTLPVTDGSPQLAGGRATQWHHHNILTGEERQTAGPGNPSRRSRDRLLWAARRWETDCCSLRLY